MDGWMDACVVGWMDVCMDEWEVSYTHLRAHETREDLVCRLLLEKKNRTRDYSCMHVT